MDWSNILGIIIGGILAIIGGIFGAYYPAKKALEKSVLEKKLNIYLEILPLISSRFESSSDYKNDRIDPYNIPNIRMLTSKVLLFANLQTKKNIKILISYLQRYNSLAGCSGDDEALSEFLGLKEKIIGAFGRLEESMKNELFFSNMHKSLDYNRGFLRLTLVVSAFTGIYVFVKSNLHTNNIEIYKYAWLLSISIIWIIYLIIKYVIISFVCKGFRATNDENLVMNRSRKNRDYKDFGKIKEV